MKVLLAVDGSGYTKRMLSFLAAHNELLSPSHAYTVIHGVLAVPNRAASFVSAGVIKEYYESEAEDVFKPIRAFLQQQGIEANFVHSIGHAAEAIAHLAEEGRFDLVVMGSRGHGEVMNLVLG